MHTIARTLNSVMILILAGILLGALYIQLVLKEEPCPLCLLQRLGMIAVAIGALLNLRFGIKMEHYGLALLGCLMGGTVALRQISLHICPGFPEFGAPVLGLSLYTWSFLVFTSCVLGISILLFLYRPNQTADEEKPSMNLLEKIAFGSIFLIAILNLIFTFIQCGIGGCEDVSHGL